MGEKDVALPYDQLTFSKDANNNLIVGTSATKESLEDRAGIQSDPAIGPKN